jgi:hypothetical protein
MIEYFVSTNDEFLFIAYGCSAHFTSSVIKLKWLHKNDFYHSLFDFSLFLFEWKKRRNWCVDLPEILCLWWSCNSIHHLLSPQKERHSSSVHWMPPLFNKRKCESLSYSHSLSISISTQSQLNLILNLNLILILSQSQSQSQSQSHSHSHSLKFVWSSLSFYCSEIYLWRGLRVYDWLQVEVFVLLENVLVQDRPTTTSLFHHTFPLRYETDRANNSNMSPKHINKWDKNRDKKISHNKNIQEHLAIVDNECVQVSLRQSVPDPKFWE